jgi:hypothetical protein
MINFLFQKKLISVKKDDKIYVIINSSQMAETLKLLVMKKKFQKKF